MSDKLTRFGQYLAQGGKDGDDKETITRKTPFENRGAGIKPAPKVK